jgi:8-oxo-dGTP pyrophosphatase MutT (NUDIX family)
MPYKIATLVYATRNGKVLLLCRKKAPLIGYWVAPGGKVDPGESPHEGAVRELYEETGLVAPQAHLRAIVTETSNRPDWQWLIFVYRVPRPRGELFSDEREGTLQWFDIDEALAHARVPEADKIFMPMVLGDSPEVVEYRFNYDDELQLMLEEGKATFSTKDRYSPQ